ncbi:MAG: hypothetical protein IH956_07095 [Chloroflexi bacterium]|nr:hypothetical protein [Chloroflexota bacterium]
MDTRIEIAEFLKRILASPGERQEIDYKAAMPFKQGTDFSLSLVRHVQGMANTGGGWLVIGFMETDEGLVPDTAHSDTITSSYEPTDFSQYINKFVARGQHIDLSIYTEENPETKQTHPIIAVEGFQRGPYICRSDVKACDTKETVLEAGAVYVRRTSASTSKVSDPSDWDELIQRCVAARRDEFLSEFRNLLDLMTSGSPLEQTEAVDDLRDWTIEMRTSALGVEERKR